MIRRKAQRGIAHLIAIAAIIIIIIILYFVFF